MNAMCSIQKGIVHKVVVMPETIFQFCAKKRITFAAQFCTSRKSSICQDELGRLTFNEIASLLRRCANSRALSKGKQIHDYIVRNGLGHERLLANLLMQMYGKCGALHDARSVFDNLLKPNSFSWNIMIAAYARQGQFKNALELFQHMPEQNVVSWNALLAGFSQHGHLKEALQLFRQMPNKDAISYNTLIMAYTQLGYLKEAVELFNCMPDRTLASWNNILAAYVQHGLVKQAQEFFQRMPERDVVSWTTMISGHAQQRELKEALHLFQQMPYKNVISWTVIIEAYAKEGHLDHAFNLFKQMPERDVVTWNVMISVLAQRGQVVEALNLFRQMPVRDIVSWNTMIAAYAQQGCLNEAHELFQQMPQRNVISWNAMIAAYAQQKQVDDAYKFFSRMPERDIVSWNVMISAYTEANMTDDALQLFQQMKNEHMLPDRVTFINVLDACGRAAALVAGKNTHKCIMTYGFELDVVVGSSLINMYGKCGSLENARGVFDKMHTRNIVAWNVMIAIYAQHGHGEEAFKMFQLMQERGFMPNEVTFGSILTACSHSGLVDDGCYCFVSSGQHHNITLNWDHYNSMVDLLGRALKLDGVDSFITSMPFEAGAIPWTSLLGSCRNNGDVRLGQRAAENLLKVDPESSAPYVLLSEIYAAAGH